MKIILCLLLPLLSLVASESEKEDHHLYTYRASPKLSGPVKLLHDRQDVILNALDDDLQKISHIYMQALLSGTHTPELEGHMRGLEMELFDLLDQLYKEKRLEDYMKYEAEVTRQMIIYNMLKRLFGYEQDKEK
ncbi:uncharacterized protein [Drosophila tropicalis]|uniref:uncharacterized protein n=1 Tax=Drosophila tropicalis TaxID=46794 RepID=UPI0035ABDB20